jgi:EAL domain-containing protein (putative c-di-GMP-specific phosphodiesterase class I)
MRLNSVSLCDTEADVLWLSEGALGPDEHSVVIEAIGALTSDTSLPYFEFGMEDGRLAVFLAVRAPKGDLVGVAMILAEMKAVPDGVVERIVTPQVRTILQKIAVFLRTKPGTAPDANGAAPAAAGAAPAADALAANVIDEILTLELAPEPAPAKPAVAGKAPSAPPAAKAPPAAAQPPKAEIPVARPTAAPKAAPAPAAKGKAPPPPPPAKAAAPAKTAPAAKGASSKPSTPPALEAQVMPPAAMDELEFVMEGVPTARAATEEETTAEVPAVSEEFVLSIADTGMMQVIPAAAAQPRGKPPAAKADAPGAKAPVAEPPVAKPAAPAAAKAAPVAQPLAAKAVAPVEEPAKPVLKAAAPSEPPAAKASTPAAPKAASEPKVAAKPAEPEPPEEVFEDAGHTVIAPPGVLAGKVAAAFKAPADDSEAGTDLVLHVQELIKLRSNGRTRRYEVLARSRSDASREEVPAHFLADSVKGQEGSKLDGYVVQRLLTWLGEHGEAVWDTEPASFSINLSIGAIEDPQFAASVEAALEASAVPTEHIGFEITEFACVQCKPQVQSFVDMVERLGCFLVIDNFTFDTRVLQMLGSSALRAVKVDPKLTNIAMKDKLSQAIVVAIAQACKVMGVHCVAKRIDSQAALQWLTAVGCDFAQGYALEKPLPIETLLPGHAKRK